MSDSNPKRSVSGTYTEKHGMSDHPLYSVWRQMNARCYNTNDKSFCDYGRRGITVCKDWRSTPESFIGWCILNGYKDGLQIDRIDNNKDYTKSNCRIVTRSQNCRNRRDNIFVSYQGVKVLLIELAEKLGFKPGTLYARIFTQGLTIEDAIDKPLRKSRG